jgi:hypothetical protein
MHSNFGDPNGTQFAHISFNNPKGTHDQNFIVFDIARSSL